MVVETKYNIGDKVWIKTLEHVCKGNVWGVVIHVFPDGSRKVIYRIESNGYYYERLEDEI